MRVLAKDRNYRTALQERNRSISCNESGECQLKKVRNRRTLENYQGNINALKPSKELPKHRKKQPED